MGEPKRVIIAEYIPHKKEYRLFAPEAPYQTVAYYDEDEKDLIQEDCRENGIDILYFADIKTTNWIR